MDTDRFRFVAGAYWEDSTALISVMNSSALVIWGTEDLNVDAHADAETYREQLKPLTQDRHVVVISFATHSLLRADLYNYQLVDDWPWYLQYLFSGMGRAAYAEYSFDQVVDWILERTEK
jgi:hypothetical protein